MSNIDDRIRRALDQQAASLTLRSARLTKRRALGWPVAAGMILVVLLAIAAAAPLLFPGDQRAGQVTPAALPGAEPAERLGPASTVCAVAADPAVMAASFVEGRDTLARCQLLLSRDGGRSWERHLENESVVALAAGPEPGVIYAGTVTGSIWRRAAGRWDAVYSSPPTAFQPVITRVVATGPRLVAAGRALLVSENGLTWRDVTPGLGGISADPASRGRFGIGDLAVLDGAVVVAVGDIVAGSGLWLHELSSGQWRRVPGPTGSVAVRAMGGHSRALIVATVDGRVWSSSDEGGSWTDISVGLRDRQVFDLSKNTSKVVAGTDQGAFVRMSSNWEPLGPPSLRLVREVLVIDGAVLLGADDGLWRILLR